MKKIGTLTLFDENNNYGGTLQAFALCNAINLMGYNCEVIKYHNGKNPIYPDSKSKMVQYSNLEVLNKVKNKLLYKLNFLIANTLAERNQLFENFRNIYIPHSTLYTDDTIKNTLDKYDVFISGSDQVWNPNAVQYGFLQSFVDQNKIKCSYAASISRDKLSEHEKEILIPYIEKFDCISVRENTAKKILKECGIENVEVNIDPTFLVDKKIWKTIIGEPIQKKKYIICYFFSDSYKYRKKLQKFCEKNNYELLFIPYAQQVYNVKDSFGMGKKINKVGPIEFLNLIYNAEFVFTDSFHGVAFSIIFNRNFYVFTRDNNENKTSKNSRIYDILNKFGLQKQLVSDNFNIDEIDKNLINYKEVNTLLEKEKEKAYEYLKKCFAVIK